MLQCILHSIFIYSNILNSNKYRISCHIVYCIVLHCMLLCKQHCMLHFTAKITPLHTELHTILHTALQTELQTAMQNALQTCKILHGVVGISDYITTPPFLNYFALAGVVAQLSLGYQIWRSTLFWGQNFRMSEKFGVKHFQVKIFVFKINSCSRI